MSLTRLCAAQWSINASIQQTGRPASEAAPHQLPARHHVQHSQQLGAPPIQPHMSLQQLTSPSRSWVGQFDASAAANIGRGHQGNHLAAALSETEFAQRFAPHPGPGRTAAWAAHGANSATSSMSHSDEAALASARSQRHPQALRGGAGGPEAAGGADPAAGPHQEFLDFPWPEVMEIPWPEVMEMSERQNRDPGAPDEQQR